MLNTPPKTQIAFDVTKSTNEVNMSGVVFKITIPTQEQECAILRQSTRRYTAGSQSPLLETCAVDDQVFTVKSERKPSPKRKTVKLKSGSCEYLTKRVQTEEPIPMRKSMKQVPTK